MLLSSFQSSPTSSSKFMRLKLFIRHCWCCLTQAVNLSITSSHSLPSQETESDSTSSAGQQTLAFFSALVAGMLAGMSYIFIAFCPEVHWVVWQSMIVPLGWIIAPVNYLIVNGVWTPTGYTAGDVIKVGYSAKWVGYCARKLLVDNAKRPLACWTADIAIVGDWARVG